jgi:hypothetical protein
MARGFDALEPSAPKWPERWSPYRSDRGKVALDDSPQSIFVLRLDPTGSRFTSAKARAWAPDRALVR